MPAWNKGKRLDKPVWNKGKKGLYKHSEESKIKIGRANHGKIPWNKGVCHTPETIRKIRISIHKKLKENPEVFRRNAKNLELIRLKKIRSYSRCHDCQNTAACIHHKNGNRKDHSSENIILLCRSCHMQRHFILGTKTGILCKKTVPVLQRTV
jgi:hypothetical protein